jgi:hypothetical protein
MIASRSIWIFILAIKKALNFRPKANLDSNPKTRNSGGSLSFRGADSAHDVQLQLLAAPKKQQATMMIGSDLPPSLNIPNG